MDCTSYSKGLKSFEFIMHSRDNQIVRRTDLLLAEIELFIAQVSQPNRS